VHNAYVALKEVIRDGVLPPGYQGSEQDPAVATEIDRTLSLLPRDIPGEDG